MGFLPISESAARQSIDSIAIFSEWRRAVVAARPYRGDMYFKREGSYEPESGLFAAFWRMSTSMTLATKPRLVCRKS